MPDPLGNVNNWLFVRRMQDPPQQQHQLQQEYPLPLNTHPLRLFHSHHTMQLDIFAILKCLLAG